ncbi:MAG TPA: YncE family protein [Vicinamibacterales bacterium]|nr:YncE family protein [Vicinamibacterales bacterium]
MGKHTFRLILGSLLAAATALTLAAARTDPNNITGSTGLVMIDKRGNLVRFFDPATLKETGTVGIGGIPHELAISPDHKFAYIPIYGDGVYGANPNPGHIIAIVDLTTRKMTGTIDVSPAIAPHGLKVDENGTLYAVCDLSRKLLVIDPKARKVQASIDIEGHGHWLAVLPDGSKAYTANKQDRLFVSVVDLKARKMVGRIEMPNGTQGIGMSPDGSRVVAADYAEPNIRVIDTATDKVIDVLKLDGVKGGGPFRLQYSPDGSRLLTTTLGANVLNVFDAANLRGKQLVVPVGRDPFGVAFTKDGKTALVSNHGDGTISVVDVASGTVKSSFTAGTGIETLAFY